MKIPACKLALFVLAIFFLHTANAQEVATDNEGDPLFTLPSTEFLKAKIALKNIGTSFTLSHFNRKLFYVVDGGLRRYTMAKSTVINFEGNVVSNTDDVLTINKKTDVSPKFKLRIARGFDSLINPSIRNFYWVASAAITGAFQHFKVYDTVSKAFAPKVKRFSPGLELSGTMFHKTDFAVSVSLSFTRSVDPDELTSYQKKNNTFYVDNNIATNGSKDGYLLPVKATNNWRFSTAIPFFPLQSKKLPIAIMPYYFIKGIDGTMHHNAGMLLSFLSEQFHLFDKPGGNYDPKARYTFDQQFGIGYNFMSTGNKEQRYFFITGTFSIGKTKAKSSKAEGEKDKLF